MEVQAETLETMKEDIRELKTENKEFRREINDLQRRTSLNERDISSVFERLRKIDSNTTWILRIIIAALVLGVLGYFFKFPTH